MDKNYSEIIDLALKSRKFSYAPYSKLFIGCAIISEKNNIFTGSNIECASFSLTICAERVAYAKAISAGDRRIKAIAIASNKIAYPFPCGACRQFMSEFGETTKVILAKSRKEFKVFELNELLPEFFSLK